MLFQILGIILAFVTIVVLLSLVVTTVSQVIQYLFRVRSRNLEQGLAVLLQRFEVAPAQCREKARAVLTSRRLSPLPDNWWVFRFLNRVSFLRSRLERREWFRLLAQYGPSGVTRIQKDEFLAAMAATAALSKDALDEAGVLFDRFEDQLRQRFTVKMRQISVGVAVVVAFVFQFSSPAILQEIMVDPGLQTRAVEMGRELAGQVSQNIGGNGDQSAVVPADLVAQIRRELAELRGLRSRLGELNILPWRSGWAFYVDNGGVAWGHLLGVMISALLLSLGAPFWYEVLRDLIKLSDPPNRPAG